MAKRDTNENDRNVRQGVSQTHHSSSASGRVTKEHITTHNYSGSELPEIYIKYMDNTTEK